MDDANFANISATLCAIEATVCALVAAHPNPRRLGKFFDSAAAALLDSPTFSDQPARRYLQQSLSRLGAEIHR